MDMDNTRDQQVAPGDPALRPARENRGLRLAATSAAIMVVTVATLAATSPVQAEQQPGPFRRAERPGAHVGNGLSHRQADQRNDSLPARQAGYASPMSPEERRQLRRDIDEHGRDLYRDRREPR